MGEHHRPALAVHQYQFRDDRRGRARSALADYKVPRLEAESALAELSEKLDKEPGAVLETIYRGLGDLKETGKPKAEIGLEKTQKELEKCMDGIRKMNETIRDMKKLGKKDKTIAARIATALQDRFVLGGYKRKLAGLEIQRAELNEKRAKFEEEANAVGEMKRMMYLGGEEATGANLIVHYLEKHRQENEGK